MALPNKNSKQVLVDKANSTMVISIAVAGFAIVFALIASRALLSQRSYQARVIEGKEAAVQQLEANQTAVEQLAVSYRAFVDTSDNVLGGNPNGTGDKDGNNAKIVLDALPSKYDFPAFITSLEKLLKTRNFSVENIGGTDDEVAQSSASSKEPTEIPFQLETTVGSYGSARDFLLLLEQSIRPIKVNKLTINGANNNSIGIQVDAVSYYQPAKGLTIEKKVVK